VKTIARFCMRRFAHHFALAQAHSVVVVMPGLPLEDVRRAAANHRRESARARRWYVPAALLSRWVEPS